MGKKSVFKGEIKFRDLGLIRDNNNKAKPPIPKRQTVTSMPETPDSFTKNSELACPHMPKNAEIYAIIITSFSLSLSCLIKIF